MTDQHLVMTRYPAAVVIETPAGYDGIPPGFKVYDRGNLGLTWNALSRSCACEEDAWSDAWRGILAREEATSTVTTEV